MGHMIIFATGLRTDSFFYEAFYARYKRHTKQMSEKEILEQYLDSPTYDVYKPADDQVYVFEQGLMRLLEANPENVKKIVKHH